MRIKSAAALATLLFATSPARADETPLAEYFRVETARIAARPLLGIESAEVWKARRPDLQAKLKAMLGLVPEPPRGDLRVDVRGTVERPDFTVERILYQSLPGLHVSANVYRPKTPRGRLPAILYVCGHSKVEKDGVIYGSKAHYQHHAAWFAANGYVCLIVDTLELGEVAGDHHGTDAHGKWWWQSRGYTPAGVEAWNGIRGIDYLVSRPDVDPGRIGVTGRSGGGATSWWIGAIDDRVAAVCPVAGITDLTNHVVDGVVEGHCDCMYFTNTERWDYGVLAALVAPKPMLIENTDKDSIFPEDGVRRIHAQVEKVYSWYGAKDRLSLIVGKGGHADTEELRHPAFAFFEKYLKDKPGTAIVEPARKVPIEELRVLNKGETFADSRNATIDGTLIPMFVPPKVPRAAAEWERMKADWIGTIKREVVAGWPADGDAVPLDMKETGDKTRGSVRMRTYEYTSQSGVRLTFWAFAGAEEGAAKLLRVEVLDEHEWRDRGSLLVRAISDDPADPKTPKAGVTVYNSGVSNTVFFVPGPAGAPRRQAGLRTEAGLVTVFVAPRGIGPTAWPDAKDTHVRRRFLLLGQTLDGMRAYDVRRAIQAARKIDDWKGAEKTEIVASRSSAPAAILAALFEPKIEAVELIHPAESIEDGPAFLNLSRNLGMAQFASLLYPRELRIEKTAKDAWRWASDLGRVLDENREWPTFDLGIPQVQRITF